MQIKQGIQASPGVAIGQAVVIDAKDFPVPRRLVPANKTAREHRRLRKALAQSRKDLEQLSQSASNTLGPKLGKIFDFHLAMLRELSPQFREMINEEHITAEYAVYSIMRRQAHKFSVIDDRYLRERASDVWDLERRVLEHLIGATRAELNQLKQDTILIAHDLTPSQTASLDKDKIKAIATDAGGRTSHTAILAHALGIPAIVGLEDITSQVNVGDMVIIDGNHGLVIINPDAEQLMTYRQSRRRMVEFDARLDEQALLPAVSLDGTEVTLWANIEFPSEIAPAIAKGATGIGLYRTEFLFLAMDAEPTEEQQFEAYKEAVDALHGRPLTIRTLDLGADKLHTSTTADHSTERNPFLGVRSIRLCLQNLPLFKTQLRAILRASAFGSVRVMFPLISNIMELRQAKMILNDVMEDLEDQGIDFDRKLPVGIMVEVPSVALQAQKFSHEVDFFSIGTNDLIQYTVAVDRSNERIASLYSSAHPAVIQLIKDVVRAANRAKIGISICGEMAGESEFVMLLLGLGLRQLSVTPPAVPEVKKIVRSVTMAQCRKIARTVSSLDSDREVLNYLREQGRTLVPEVFDNGPM